MERTPGSEELAAVRRRVESAATASGARLESLDFVRPLGDAWALVLQVGEPHSFLRERLVPLLRDLDPATRAVTGDYLELRDGSPEPVFVRGCVRTRFGHGCGSEPAATSSAARLGWVSAASSTSRRRLAARSSASPSRRSWL